MRRREAAELLKRHGFKFVRYASSSHEIWSDGTTIIGFTQRMGNSRWKPWLTSQIRRALEKRRAS